MQGADVLEIIAEVAITLAGFSGVVAALGHRASGAWTPLDWTRLVSLITISLATVVGCLVPFVLHHAGQEGASIWGWSSAFLLVWVLSASAMTTVRVGDERFRGYNPVALVVLTAIQIATALLLLCNVAGIGLERTFAPYLTALILQLFQAGVFFVRLLATSFPTTD